MIVKKIRNSKSRSTKTARIAKLIAYIRDPVSRNGSEKCVYEGARGFLTDGVDEQVEEMCALALDAVRSKDPINHYVLSWREGEHPTVDHVEEAVTIFLDGMGLSEHQAVYGLHADTDNVHLHICVNRVIPWHLRTGMTSVDLDCVDGSAERLPGSSLRTVAEINRGFDLEAAHMAVACITHVQGWMPEQNARFAVSSGGEVIRTDRCDRRRVAVSTRKADMEVRTGEKSAERIAKEIAAPLITNARSWDELHLSLAAVGIRYEKTGSGATVFVGDIPVKASTVDRKASLAQLAKRLGGFCAAAESKEVAAREPQPLQVEAPGWTDYTVERRSHSHAKKLAAAHMQRQHSQERGRLVAEYRVRRGKLFAGSWRGRGYQLNALRSVLAAEHAMAVAELKERQQAERIVMRRRFGRFPDLEQWLRDHHGPVAATRWRQRSSAIVFRIEGLYDSAASVSPTDIRAFSRHIGSGGEMHYRRSTEDWSAFVDYGRYVGVFESQCEDVVLAALQLASAKWPMGIGVSGDDAFKQLCAKLAASHGIVLHNPELKSSIADQQSRAVQGYSAAAASAPLEM